jgi:heparan-alpha-glucosaminide N-acetyltransferase
MDKALQLPVIPRKVKLNDENKEVPDRLLSIDVFRALTMFFMIFVNDVDGVKNIPEWIKHVGASDDGLGFADTIFPAFLFIVGLSLPFAIRKRIKNGAPSYVVLTYILSRSIALLVMGFLQVNLENYNSISLLPKAVWEIFITIGFFLIWLDYPKDLGKAKRSFLQAAGIFILVLMAYLYKGGEPTTPVGLKPYWWGILGIIGWSYLVCALIYFFSYGKLWVQATFLSLFLLLNILFHTNLLKIKIPVIGDASSEALTMAGVLVSILYTRFTSKRKEKLRWILLAMGGCALFIFGVIIRPYAGGISKIHSTSAWILICIGISIVIFELIIYLVDIQGKQNWFKGIRPAGTSTLTCYLIPYLLYSIYSLFGFHYPGFFNQGPGGIIRSFLVAFIVIWIAGMLEKGKIRLRI